MPSTANKRAAVSRLHSALNLAGLTNRAATVSPAVLQQIKSAVEEAIAGLDYGSIILTVHDARVVQLDVTRRRRFTD